MGTEISNGSETESSIADKNYSVGGTSDTINRNSLDFHYTTPTPTFDIEPIFIILSLPQHLT